MAKKAEPLKEIYAIVNENDLILSWCSTLDEAKKEIMNNEGNNSQILKVVQIWNAVYPEEPEIEFYETSLEEL